METVHKDAALALVAALTNENNPAQAAQAQSTLDNWAMAQEMGNLEFTPDALEVLRPFM
jgi:hypothetical protein